MQADANRISPSVVLIVSAALALASMIAFMTVGAKGSWSFLLSFRGTKLLGLVLVAYAIAVSTVLFQTISGNRILTPSIIGFDAMYALLQTIMVFFLGAAGATAADARLQFTIETATMVGFSLLLFRALFSGASRSLHLLMLVGIILGGLFRSLSSFLQRILDPNDFIVLQDRLFASFNSINADLLGIATVATLAVTFALWRLSPTFDVLSLGREAAIGLGVDHQRVVTLLLVLIAVLVSVSTALVGPVTFFGLLVASLAWQLTPTASHRFVLPVAVAIAITTLVGGQVVLERLFAFNTALSIVIEFFGGLVFIFLLVRGSQR
ncbi:iron chelate uptake ABC transporter family permease subunit [Ensifer sp.]|jgi:iron complex transport system permease protein|uniref:iron chelate uptake ABC transporter family permease subunit n=1 Tax=Ensifer sp. TaxID=1872086 RepID=UPI002E1605C5|nr:iron chelate uptake ABC transporter family permease subunit [Ensifer sp.]